MAKKKATEPKFELVAADCVGFMRSKWPKPAGRPRLVIADPPYNYGEPYDSYNDNKPFDEYMKWSEEWLACLDTFATHPDASVWLIYPDELVSFVDVFCQKTLRWHKRSHVVWYFTFGVCNSSGRNFSRSHAHALYYTKKKTVFTFNESAIMVPSARQLVYNDKRASPRGKAADNTWMLLKGEMDKVMGGDQDTWLENRVCGTYSERQPESPNQLPLPLVERMLLATSNPGDLVYDPFVGSGTTVLAAFKHGRFGVGTDLSEKSIANAKYRVSARGDS